MIKRLGILMGSAFLLGGLLGFVPGVVKDGLYLGIFMVNTPHNILHIASGAIFLVASSLGPGFARLWFQVFGIAYAAMAAWGFQVGDRMICGIISNNRYDSWGHAALALMMLLIGFAIPKQIATIMKPSSQPGAE
ncbi:MAG TPA: DUF4383 domain-containing protein [Xanthobacteraceae bacterium]|jgi:hypothetical protein